MEQLTYSGEHPLLLLPADAQGSRVSCLLDEVTARSPEAHHHPHSLDDTRDRNRQISFAPLDNKTAV